MICKCLCVLGNKYTNYYAILSLFSLVKISNYPLNLDIGIKLVRLTNDGTKSLSGLNSVTKQKHKIKKRHGSPPPGWNKSPEKPVVTEVLTEW